MGILEVLTTIFVILKLVGVINWSWWLVFLPLIVSITIYVIFHVIIGTTYIKTKREIERDFKDF